jgi:hypothetical protein
MRKFLQLLGTHAGRRFGQRALRALRLGKRDDIANRIGATQQHDQPVEAERNAAVRRRAILQRFQQEAELRLSLFLADPQQIQNPQLDVATMIANATTADFAPVEHHIVGLGPGP